MSTINPITGLPVKETTTVAPQSPVAINPVTGIPMKNDPSQGGGLTFRANEAVQQGNFGGPEVRITEEEASRRLPNIQSREEFAEGRARTQPTSEKWANGLAKAGITTVGAFAENTLGIAAGLISVAQGGSFYDTSLGRAIDEMNEEAQKSLPNYYTQKAQEDSLLASTLTANFWADKVSNGIGYSLASIVSAAIPLGPIGNIGRAGRMIQQANRIKRQKQGIDALIKGDHMGVSGGEILKKILENKAVIEAGKGAYNTVTYGERILGSALAESNVEARELKNTFLEDNIEKALEENRAAYIAQNPNATPEELANIGLSQEQSNRLKDYSEIAGTANFFTNAVVVGGANAIMFGRLMKGKSMNAIQEANLGKNVRWDPKLNKFVDDRSKFTKFIDKVEGREEATGWTRLYGVAEGSVTEAFQEGAQFTSSKAYGDFFAKKLADPNSVGLNDLIKSFGEAAYETVTTKEGLESMLIGAIVGGGTTSIRSMVELAQGNKKTETRSSQIEKIADYATKHFGYLQTEARMQESLGLAKAGISYKNDMDEAARRGDAIGYAMAYNGATDATVLQALHLGIMDSVIDRYRDAATLPDAEFAEFFGIKDLNELQQKEGFTKQTLVEEIIADLETKREIFNKVEANFATEQTDQTAVDWIVKKTNPEYYKATQIEEMLNNYRKQQMYIAMSNKNKLDAELAKVSQEIEKYKQSVSPSLLKRYQDIKEKSLGKKGELSNEELDTIAEQMANLTTVLNKKISNKQFDDFKKNSPEAYKVLVDIYNNIVAPKVPSRAPREIRRTNDITINDLAEILKVTPQQAIPTDLLDILNYLEFATALDQREIGKQVSKFLQIAALQAEAEYDFNVMSNKNTQRSFMAEHIKMREAALKKQAETMTDPRNISELKQESKAPQSVLAGIEFTAREIDLSATPAKIEEDYLFNIKGFKDALEASKKLPDGTDIKDKAVSLNEKDLKKWQSEYENWKTQNKAEENAERFRNIVRNSSFITNFTLLDKYKDKDGMLPLEFREAMKNLYSIPRDGSDILSRITIKVEQWKHTPTKNRNIGNRVIERFGMPNDNNLGVYVYFDGKLIAGLPHPDRFTIDREVVDVSNMEHLSMMNSEFVDKDGKITVEGIKFSNNLQMMRKVFSKLTKIGDEVSAEEFKEFAEYGESVYPTLGTIKEGERPSLEALLSDRGNQYGITGIENIPDGVVVFMEKRWIPLLGEHSYKFYLRYPDNTIQDVEQGTPTFNTLVETTKKIDKDYGALNNFRQLIVQNRGRMQHVALQSPSLEFNQEKFDIALNNILEVYKEIVNNPKKYPDKTSIENYLKGLGEEGNPLYFGNNEERPFLTTQSDLPVNIYLNFNMFKDKTDEGKKLGVYLRPLSLAIKARVGERTAYVDIGIFVNKDGILNYTKGEEGTKLIKNAKDLTEALNYFIEKKFNYTISTDPTNKNLDLFSLRINNLKLQKASEEFGIEEVVAEPGFTPHFYAKENAGLPSNKKGKSQNRKANATVVDINIAALKAMVTEVATGVAVEPAALIEQFKKTFKVNGKNSVAQIERLNDLIEEIYGEEAFLSALDPNISPILIEIIEEFRQKVFEMSEAPVSQAEVDEAIPVEEDDEAIPVVDSEEITGEFATRESLQEKSKKEEEPVNSLVAEAYNSLSGAEKTFWIEVVGGITEMPTDANNVVENSEKFLSQLPKYEGVLAMQPPQVMGLINKMNNASSPFKLQDIAKEGIDITKATENIARILSIPVQSVHRLGVRLGLQPNVSVSRFIDGVIQLDENAVQGTEYHEAFHAVFRTYLDDGQIQRVLKEAKKKYGKPTQAQLDEFVQMMSTRKYLNATALENLWVEEQLADEFQQYMKQKKAPSSNIIARIFEMLMEFINKLRGKHGQVETLFKDIAIGKFKNASAVYNVYSATSDTAYKILYTVKETNISPISREFSNSIIADVAKKVYDSIEEAANEEREFLYDYDEDGSIIEVRLPSNNFDYYFKQALEDVKFYYSEDNFKEELKALETSDAYSDAQKTDILRRIRQAGAIFDPTNPKYEENKAIIKDEVKALTSFNIKSLSEALEEEAEEDLMEDTPEKWMLENHMTTSFEKAPAAIKNLIAMVSAPRDEFGWGKIIDLDNNKYHRPIVDISIYTSMQMALLEVERKDMLRVLKKHVSLQDAPRRFYEMLSDTIAKEIRRKSDAVETVEAHNVHELPLEILEKSNTFNLISSNFQGTRILKTDLIYDKKKRTINIVQSAGRNVAKDQFSRWRANFNYNRLTSKQATNAVYEIHKLSRHNVGVLREGDARLDLNKLKSLLNPKNNEESLLQRLKAIQEQYKRIGIELSLSYLEFSFVKDNLKLFNELNNEVLPTEENSGLVAKLKDYSIYLQTKDHVLSATEVLSTENFDLGALSVAIQFNENNPMLFYLDNIDVIHQNAKDKEAKKQELEEKGIFSRLYNLAEANAVFDESLYPTTFRNMAGKQETTLSKPFGNKQRLSTIRSAIFSEIAETVQGLKQSTPNFSELSSDQIAQLFNLMTKLEDYGYTFPTPDYKLFTSHALFNSIYLNDITAESILNNIDLGLEGDLRDAALEDADKEEEIIDANSKVNKYRGKGKEYKKANPEDKVISDIAHYSRPKGTVLVAKRQSFSKKAMYARTKAVVNEAKKRQFTWSLPKLNLIADNSTKLSKEGMNKFKQVLMAELDFIMNFNGYNGKQGIQAIDKVTVSNRKFDSDGRIISEDFKFLDIKTDEDGVAEIVGFKEGEAIPSTFTIHNLANNNFAVNETLDRLIIAILNNKEAGFNMSNLIGPEGIITEAEAETMIQQIIDEKVNDYIELLKSPEYGILTETEGKLRNRSLPNAFVNEDKIGERKIYVPNMNKIADYVANDYLGTIEMYTLLNFNEHKTSILGPQNIVKREGLNAGDGPSMGAGKSKIAVVKSIKTTDSKYSKTLSAEDASESARHGVDLSDINTTDAISYTNAHWFYNVYAKSQGYLNGQVPTILKKIRIGFDLTAEEISILQNNKILLQSLKLQSKVPFFSLKTSVDILTRSETSNIKKGSHKALEEIFNSIFKAEEQSLTKGIYMGKEFSLKYLYRLANQYYTAKPGREELHEMLNNMAEEEIDIVATEDAVKNILPRYGSMDYNDSSNYLSNMVVDLDNMNIRKQVETGGLKDKVTDGTQKLLLAPIEIANKIIQLQGKSVNGDNLVKAYFNEISRRMDLGMAQKNKELLLEAYGGGFAARYDIIIKQFQETIQDTGADIYVAEMFSSENSSTLTYDLNFPSISGKFEAMFLSMLSSNSLKHKVKGSKFTLKPDFGFKIKDSETGKMRRLQHRIEENGEYYTEAIVSRIYAKMLGLNIGDNIPQKYLKFFGIRIPTQDKHSMVTVKVVDFLPAEKGNVIILPYEIVKLAGSDFDIDALYTQFYDIFRGKEGITHYGNYVNSFYTNEQKPEAILALQVNSAEEEYYQDLISNNKLVKKLLKDVGINKTAFKKFSENEIASLYRLLEANKIPRVNDIFDGNRTLRQVILDNIKHYEAGNIDKILSITIPESNNRLLEYQMSMLNNEYNKDIAAESADRDLFIDKVEQYKKDGIIAEDMISEAFSIANKHKLEQNNAVGQDNIGVAAKFNTSIPFLAGLEFGKDFKIFGKSKFDITTDENNHLISSEGNMRLIKIVDQIITAMTDNAKFNDSGYLNLNVGSLGVAQVALAMGKSFNFAIDFVNQDSTKLYSTLIQKTKSLTTEAEIAKDNVYPHILKELGLEKADNTIVLTDDLLARALLYKAQIGQETQTSNLTEQEYKNIQAAALLEFTKAEEVVEELIDFGKITSLLKGAPSSFAGLELIGNAIERFNKPSIIRYDAIREKYPIFRSFENSYKEFNKLASYFLVTQSAPFKEILFSLSNTIREDSFEYEESIKDAKNQLLSFLTIAALRNRGNITSNLSMLFTPDLHNEIRKFRDTHPDFKNNHFLDFIKLNKTVFEKGPFGGNNFYNVQGQTQGKKEAAIAAQILDGFTTLHNHPEGNALAKKLVEFLMIKDGFIFKNGTFVTNIEPHILKMANIFNTTKAITRLFNGQDNNVSFEKLFGMSKEKLTFEFISKFTRNTNNIPFLKRTTNDQFGKDAVKSFIEIVDGTIKINLAPTSGTSDRYTEVIKQRAKALTDNFERSRLFTRNKDGKVNFPLTFKTTQAQFTNYTMTEVVVGFENGEPVILNLRDVREADFDKLFNKDRSIAGYSVTYTQSPYIGSKNISPYFNTVGELNLIASGGLKALHPEIAAKVAAEEAAEKARSVEKLKNTLKPNLKDNKTINVYWEQAESNTSTKILSNLAPRKFNWQGREYGSVEHAYQSNKSGIFDEITYNKYVKAGGYGTKIRGKQANKVSSLQLMKDLVVESFKQNPNSEAAKKLLQYENFTHNTNEVIDQAFLEGLKLARQLLLNNQNSEDNLDFETQNKIRNILISPTTNTVLNIRMSKKMGISVQESSKLMNSIDNNIVAITDFVNQQKGLEKTNNNIIDSIIYYFQCK